MLAAVLKFFLMNTPQIVLTFAIYSGLYGFTFEASWLTTSIVIDPSWFLTGDSYTDLRNVGIVAFAYMCIQSLTGKLIKTDGEARGEGFFSLIPLLPLALQFYTGLTISIDYTLVIVAAILHDLIFNTSSVIKKSPPS